MPAVLVGSRMRLNSAKFVGKSVAHTASRAVRGERRCHEHKPTFERPLRLRNCEIDDRFPTQSRRQR